MFGNFVAQAGVIAFSPSVSPNIITPKLDWDFNNVLVLDFNPPGITNINDRPRINIWRDIDGIPDFNYLIYVSGGRNVLSPAPTGKLIQPWGDRNTGTITFPTTSLSENKVTVGIDLFTHNFALPVNISPPINQWTIDSTSVTGEIKYQYRFTVGPKNPNINISLDYFQSCKPVNIPNCSPNQDLIFVGTGVLNGCPIFICQDTNTFIERGALYNINSWTGNGIAGFGSWRFISGSRTTRSIENSTQYAPLGNRTDILEPAFFAVGGIDTTPRSHIINYDLSRQISSGTSFSIDVNYGWNAGRREVSFVGPLVQGDSQRRHFSFIHELSDELRYSVSTSTAPIAAFPSTVIISNVYQKAYKYLFKNLGTGVRIEVSQYIVGKSVNSIPQLITGFNYPGSSNWSDLITGIRIEASLNSGAGGFSNIIDRNNFGIFFNNIEFISGLS